MKNENVASQMIEILQHLHKYVPVGHQVFLGGDQLTSERGRNAQLSMQDGRTPTECLQGVICKSEDWHAGVAFLSVLFQILYKESSVNDKGTLYQLQKLINRTYVSRKVSKHVSSVEEFVSIVCDAYVTSAAMNHLKLSSVTDSYQLGSNPKDHINSIATVIVDKYVLSEEMDQRRFDEFKDNTGEVGKKFQCRIMSCQRKFSHPSLRNRHELKEHQQDLTDTHDRAEIPADQSSSVRGTDHVFEYGAAFMKMALLYRNFTDAIHEGDGQRVCLVWKYFTLHFFAYRHTKYALEGLILSA